MKIFISILVGLFLAAAVALQAPAQTYVRVPDCLQPFVISAVGTSQMYDNRGSGCTDWTVTYSSYGFSALSMQVTTASNNNGALGATAAFGGTILGGITQPVSVLTSNTFSMLGYYPYMGVSLLSKTGTGSIQGTLYGYRRNSGSIFNYPTILNSTVVVLTDGATPALDAAQGNLFVLTAAGNRTIAIPSNATSGQRIIIRHTASGGARTLSLNTGAGGFRFGTDVTALTATTSGTSDYIAAIYNATDSFWDVVAYSKGF